MIPTLSKMPDQLRQAVNRHAVFDILKEQAKESLIANSVDYVTLAHDFVIRKSLNTQATYLLGLNLFFRHCHILGIHPLTIQPNQVDQYIDTLTHDLQPNSVRVRVFAVSSFFRHMKRYRYIASNPFVGATVPQKKYKYAHNSSPMTQGDYNVIMDTIATLLAIEPITQAQKNKVKSLCMLQGALAIMRHYGLRVGALDAIVVSGGDTLSPVKELFFTTKTKGAKQIKRKIEVDLKFFEFKFKKNTIQKAFHRLCVSLFNQKKINKVYNCHDIRHLFAVEYYSGSKDIVGLKNQLGHSSLQVTDVYLQSVYGSLDGTTVPI